MIAEPAPHAGRRLAILTERAELRLCSGPRRRASARRPIRDSARGDRARSPGSCHERPTRIRHTDGAPGRAGRRDRLRYRRRLRREAAGPMRRRGDPHRAAERRRDPSLWPLPRRPPRPQRRRPPRFAQCREAQRRPRSRRRDGRTAREQADRVESAPDHVVEGPRRPPPCPPRPDASALPEDELPLDQRLRDRRPLRVVPGRQPHPGGPRWHDLRHRRPRPRAARLGRRRRRLLRRRDRLGCRHGRSGGSAAR